MSRFIGVLLLHYLLLHVLLLTCACTPLVLCPEYLDFAGFCTEVLPLVLHGIIGDLLLSVLLKADCESRSFCKACIEYSFATHTPMAALAHCHQDKFV